jgi:hypothetical protein
MKAMTPRQEKAPSKKKSITDVVRSPLQRLALKQMQNTVRLEFIYNLVAFWNPFERNHS